MQHPPLPSFFRTDDRSIAQVQRALSAKPFAQATAPSGYCVRSTYHQDDLGILVTVHAPDDKVIAAAYYALSTGYDDYDHHDHEALRLAGLALGVVPSALDAALAASAQEIVKGIADPTQVDELDGDEPSDEPEDKS